MVCYAEQFVIEFDATIEEIVGFEAGEPPFGLTVSQPLSGRYVFDSISDFRSVMLGGFSQGQLLLEVNGNQVSYPANKGIINIGRPGGLSGPAGPLATMLSLGFFPQVEGNVGSIPFDSTLSLMGPPDTFDLPADAANIEKWNELDASRVLSLRFGPDGTANASVSVLRIVPEPSGVVLLSVAATALNTRRRSKP